ncbi:MULTISPECIES: agmatine deiminase family protein [unclassified Nitratiruptor]|uniref:agmatine deiminase family protein n=1 Tax=unclassified Nitratiruptor TaxID=2624044 RepID=UPI0019165D56|nr:MULTISPECIES: agmatine deiminase family protein [unclassified Nitratiruptor]BCD59683.1 agmatine deiminase [Nitratiruptor sp. YY08-10]BCD63607.1 agmatine deiminase [Nitratiruptor sp. YY08-14]
MKLPAEWERQKALLVAYPHEESDWSPYLEEARDFFNEFISIVTHYQDVYLISQEDLSFPPTKHDIKIFKAQTNDTWVRDFGPITIFENDRPKLLDFTFNGWGLKYPANYDNLLNRKIFNTKKIGFVLEGGSIDSNGKGLLLTTTSCLLEANRNPYMTQDEIETYLKTTLGVETIFWLNHGFLEGDDTDGHIDMLARFISPDTVVYVECDDPKDIHYEALQKMKQQLQNFGLKTIPLPWIEPKYYDGERLPASYANFVFINNAIIVPTYQDSNDEAALSLFRSLFPDRDVIGLDASVLIRQHGSIHCSCMNLF